MVSAQGGPLDPYTRDDLRNLPDECTFTACDRDPVKAIRFEDPDDLLPYCKSCAARAEQRSDAKAVVRL